MKGHRRLMISVGLALGVLSAYGSGDARLVTLLAVGTQSSADAFIVRSAFNGVDFTGASAADLSIAVGPSSVALVANFSIVLRDKNGGMIASETFPRFFDSVDRARTQTGGYDPRVYFDPSTSRFFFVTASVASQGGICVPAACHGSILLAVSKNANPRTLGPTDWQLSAMDAMFDMETATPSYAGEPVLGFNDDAVVLYMGLVDAIAHTGHGSAIRVFSKSALIANAALTRTEIRPPGNSGLNMMPTGYSSFSEGTIPMIQSSQNTGCPIYFWTLERPLNSPRLSFQAASSTANCSGRPPRPEQPGTARPFDNIDTSLFQGSAFYKNGSAWATHAVASANSTLSEVRWAQVDVIQWPTSVKIIQESRIKADSRYLYYPVVASDDRGNAIIAYAQSGKAEAASLYFSGRLTTDPQNTLRSSVLLKAGSGSLDTGGSGANRYGDYFGIAIDPVDGSFWVHGMYAISSTQWGSWVSNIAVK